jgi:hypothetical protein
VTSIASTSVQKFVDYHESGIKVTGNGFTCHQFVWRGHDETVDRFFVSVWMRKFVGSSSSVHNLQPFKPQAIAHPNIMKCGPPPSKMTGDCCEDLNKIAKPEIFPECKSKCGMDGCCLGTCFAQPMGFLKDGKFDSSTAITSMNSVFAANPEWHPVRERDRFLVIFTALTFNSSR